MPRRVYIYRSGATDVWALTAARNDPRLPQGSGDSWRFWMQIGPLQVQGDRYGFDIQAAASAITANGYYLFTGSTALLGGRLCSSSRLSSKKGQFNA